MAITSNGDKFLYGGASQQSSPARYPWRAGAAQPRRASQGTNYGAPSQGLPETPKAKSSSGDYSVYSPQSFTMPGYQTRQQSDGSEQYTGQNDFGNFGNMPVNHRPLPFSAQYTNFDGTTSSQPNFGRRDAFIQNINDAMMPYYGGKTQGAPQFDFQNMWKSAGDMVQNGWQNPFSMQPPSLDQKLAQYAPPSQYSPQPTSIPNDPYSQFRPDDSGMLYRPGVNAPASTSPASQKPFDMYWGHGNQAGWEAAGAPKSAPMLSPGLLGWDVNPRNPNAVPYSPPPAPLGPDGFPLYYY